MSRYISLGVLLALILLLGSMFYRVISPFLLPLFLAAVLAVICQPLQKYFLRKTGGRTSWAAALTTATVTLMIVGPLTVGTFVAAMNLYTLADQHLGGDWRNGLDVVWRQALMPALDKVAPFVPGGVSDERLLELKAELTENLKTLATQMAGTTFSIASSTVGMFVSLAVAGGMFLTALYYFLADGPAILLAAEELIPLPVDHQRQLRERFASVVRAVVTATFAAAFAQGLATALALQVVGIQHFFIFLVVGSIASLIPLAGAWMVWGPCAAWLALQGHWGAAIGLTLWGLAVVGMLDNLVKMYVLQSEADLHPLIAFISVIGALQVMGLWGIFIGPIVASCLFALVQIFNVELKEAAKGRDASPESAGAQPVLAPTGLPTISPVADTTANQVAGSSASNTASRIAGNN
ncbi:MAG: AI-2E family transporter [Planctomycetes bacterium]|nr:AI-2E family transporter [Planctomycetota bacterium]